MTDEQAARLRALATASLSTVKGRFDLAMEGDAILALLDALDEARRERDEAKRDARELRFLWEQRGERANKAEDERDAAVALLREARDWSPSVFSPALRARIDALLGGGEGAL